MTIYPLGDQGLCISWGSKIDERLNARVLAAYERLRLAALPGVLNLVPAYCSLSVLFDARRLLRDSPGISPYEHLRAQVEPLLQNLDASEFSTGRLLEIPVCYAPAFAPELESLARKAQLSVAEVVRLHTNRTYRVYMLGFLPGFPYLGTVDERIAAPRLSSPRLKVPAGSVGIAGLQTGIYPLESPGGWNLIGRTPLRLFAQDREEPVLLRPGDRVRFVEITQAEFLEKNGQQ